MDIAYPKTDMSGSLALKLNHPLKKPVSADFFLLNVPKKPKQAVLAEAAPIFTEKLDKLDKKDTPSVSAKALKTDPALLFAGQKPVSEKIVAPKEVTAEPVVKAKPVVINPVKTQFLPSIFKFFKETLRFTAVAATIFTVGFIGLNFSSYRLLAGQWLTNSFFTPSADLLSEPVEPTPEEPLPVAVINNPDQLKKDIPALNIAVAPPDYRLIIPKINVNAPIVRSDTLALHEKDWTALEKNILKDLEKGVVHYPGTGLPGEKGNTVITGHSSYYPWSPGKYKSVFAPLHDLKVNDEIIIWKNGQKYVYKVTQRKVVKPGDVEVMQATDDYRLTLVTCTPVGTTLNRLIIVAEKV